MGFLSSGSQDPSLKSDQGPNSKVLGRWRLTSLFVVTAIAAFSIATLVVNHIASELAIGNLVQSAEADAAKRASHVEFVLRNQLHDHILLPHNETAATDDSMERVKSLPQSTPLTLEYLKSAEGLPKVIQTEARDLNIEKFNLFDLNGNIVWSSDTDSVNKIKHNTSLFQRATKGEIVSRIELEKTRTNLEGGAETFDTVETFLALRDTPSGEIIGVMEIHGDAGGQLHLQATNIRSTILITTMATMGVLFLVLFGFILAADLSLYRGKKRQLAAAAEIQQTLEYRVKQRTLELEEAREGLESQVLERTSDLRAANENLVASNQQIKAANDNLIAEINERQKLELVEQIRSQELAVADEIARILISTLHPDQVYDLFGIEVKKLVDYDWFSVRIFDHDAKSFTIRNRSGIGEPSRHVGEVVPLEETQIGEMIESQESLIRFDIKDDLRCSVDQINLAKGIRSSALIPLVSKGRVIGCIHLCSRRIGAFGDREQAILERLANQITPAVERASVYEDLQIKIQEMELVDEVARVVTSTLNIEQVFEQFALEIKKLVDFEGASINIIDLEAATVTLKYLFGPARPGRPLGSVVPYEGSYTQRIIQKGRPLVQEDIDYDPTILRGREFSIVGTQLIAKGHPIGSMTLRSKQAGGFGPREQVILERLANQIAPAIENARLHEERVRAEEILAQAQKMETVGQLAGGVAHDFNNQLSVITGYTSMLLSEAPESKNADKLREIAKAAERSTQLTSELLGFSRRQVTKPIVLDVSAAVMNSYGMLRRVIGENIELVMLPAEGLPAVFMDPNQLDQIIMNLVVNARDAMPESGTLTISASHNQGESSPGHIGNCVVLSVSDTGVGMSEEVQDHIFEPFFTTKEMGKGTGLGLATCYGILEQNGGHIEVDSELGRGSTFRIYIPVTLERNEANLDNDLTPVVPNSAAGTETILLVEDEPAVRAMEATILGDQGYLVLEAGDGEEALRVCQANKDQEIQLLVTDMVMPRMSGGELISEMSVRCPDTKFLVVSGYSEDALERSVVARSDVRFMQKPFRPMELADTVRDILDGVPAPVV